jgi:hypothetical protein
MAPHQYQQSGPLRVRMEDGTEIEAGKAAAVPRTRRLGHGRRTGGRTRHDQTIARLNNRRSPSRQAERLRVVGPQSRFRHRTGGPGRGPGAPTGRVHHTRRSAVTFQAPSAKVQRAMGPHRGNRLSDERLRQALLLQGGSGSGACSRVAGRTLRARRPADCPAGT